MALSQLSNRKRRHSFLVLSWHPSGRTTKVKMALDSAYRTSSRAKKDEHDARGLTTGKIVVKDIRVFAVVVAEIVFGIVFVANDMVAAKSELLSVVLSVFVIRSSLESFVSALACTDNRCFQNLQVSGLANEAKPSGEQHRLQQRQTLSPSTASCQVRSPRITAEVAEISGSALLLVVWGLSFFSSVAEAVDASGGLGKTKEDDIGFVKKESNSEFSSISSLTIMSLGASEGSPYPSTASAQIACSTSLR